MIHIINKQQSVAIDINALKTDVTKILQALDYSDFDINILLASDDVMHEYNHQYRQKDKATDILSFPFYPKLQAGERIKPRHDDEKILGDIIIAPEYVKNDLERWGVSFDRRMQELIVHGILHLLGYDHIDDADYEIMHKKELWLLEQL